jgi:cellulose synthase/poly-beta-1,6-N-acetylglucosamine synthase-like glycosyltransferase
MKVIQNEKNVGKRIGIKNAVLKTHADLILSVDSDVIVDKSALRELVRHLYTTGVPMRLAAACSCPMPTPTGSRACRQ